MAIELPEQVVSFLQFIGVNWPNIDEDKVREFGSHVRDFAQKLDDTHKESTATVKQLEDVYQGASYEALLAKWGQMSDSHMTELVNACHTVATALDIAADTIVAMKVEAIAELTVPAITFIADQAAAVATLGIAEAAEALVVEAAEKLMDYLVQQLEQYIIGQVIEAAIDPLVETVGKAVGGLVFQAAESALGVSAGGGGGSAGESFSIHPEALHARAEKMHGHARLVAGHAAEFEQVSFTWDGTTLCEQTTLVHGTATQATLTWDHQGLHPLTQAERITAADAPQEEIDSRFFTIVTDLVGTPTELVDEAGEIAWRTRGTLWGSNDTVNELMSGARNEAEARDVLKYMRAGMLAGPWPT